MSNLKYNVMNETLFQKLCTEKTLMAAWQQVKKKGAAGGIDGKSVKDVDEKLHECLCEIQQELKDKTWKPQPYLRIFIPKKENEVRKLGLLSVKDKIVQQAIKMQIEPRFEKIFVKNSYGYRPDKGHTRAIRSALHLIRSKQANYILRLDIDNYFDSIDHDILFKRLTPLITDSEMMRLVQLCIKMGMVSHKMKWDEINTGVPQGAVLSPLLSNYYLHSFDQFVLSKTRMYVRYADDFIILTETKEEAESLQKAGAEFLKKRLKLQLNTPEIKEAKEGMEFLGITLNKKGLSLSDKKKTTLHERIEEMEWEQQSFSQKGLKQLTGIHNYYGNLLPDEYLKDFDEVLFRRLQTVIEEKWQEIKSKSILLEALKSIDFFSTDYILNKARHRNELVMHYLSLKGKADREKNEEKNKALIKQRKREYRKLENEASELVVNQTGSYIGIGKKGITLKLFGKPKELPPMNNLNHITLIGNGISLSSNAVSYCMQNKIGIDFFSGNGYHIASLMSGSYLQTTLWQQQAAMTTEKRSRLAARIIFGKLKNQLNLIKYFHKYHKKTSSVLNETYEEVVPRIAKLIENIKGYTTTEEYRTDLMGWEAAGAVSYWGYIRELLSDDHIGFERREHQGATDLMNCMLNYGYAILYGRIWRSVMFRKMNPMDGMIHAGNGTKPTFVYDIIELFRTQAVDRVVITLIQKGEPLGISKGLLNEGTKKLLVQNIIERINRYETYRDCESRLSDIINMQTKEIAEYIASDKTFRPYIAKW